PEQSFDSQADKQLETALIASGIGFIQGETVEKYVPQEINFDLTGGIHFEKGCYPGQEVVARSHYLGKNKRRAFIAHSVGSNPVAGQDVWLVGKNNEPVGSVVNASGSLALIDCPVDLATAPESQFTLSSQAEASQNPESQAAQAFGLELPPYDVFTKGRQL
ncbi:MAG: folate-binding protein YgfZ, partial [Limnobacter sp.]|nr:folate-binding protein YgfZ [Limnobacter sp.]